MASNNRATQINKVLKVVKKHFKPAEIPADRSLLDHLIYACLAENSLHAAASETFELLAHDYYDWNEVRVTSIRELTEVMKRLHDPEESATRVKRVLQSVFETHYSFDLELLKKQNIGQTVKQFEKYNGTTNYTVAFVTQNALGGHAIPVNRGLLEAMRAVGVISDTEAKKGTVPGLERAVPKSKGAEVGTILHQLGVELYRSPYGPTIRKLLLEIEPSCKDNLPKRPSKKVVEPEPKKPAKAEKTPTGKSPAGKAAASPAKEAAKATKKPAAEAKAAPAKTKTVKKKTVKKAAKKVAKKTPAKKKVVKKPAVKKTAAGKKKTAKKKPVKKPVGKKATKAKKKTTTTKKLKKRKPR